MTEAQTEAWQRQWLAVNSSLRTLKKLNYSFTILDEEKEHLEEVIRQLEIIKKLLEGKND